MKTIPWWGEDVMPRFRWKLLVDGLHRYERTIKEGEEIMPSYGIAYYEPGRDVAVCYPIPINLVIGAWRSFKWHVMCPPWRFTEYKGSRIWEWKRETYDRGRRDGYDEAMARALRERAMLEHQNAQMLKTIVDFETLARPLQIVFTEHPPR